MDTQNIAQHLANIAQQNGFDGKRGCHSGSGPDGTTALAQDAAEAQNNLCWLCGNPFCEADPAEADRLALGSTLGVCREDAGCRKSCRCGYRRGNIGAAHAACHSGQNSVREHLARTNPEHLAYLARTFVPTAQAMREAAATRREDAGREARREAVVAERLAQALAR